MNNEKKFKKLTPFKMQVLQSFPFIDEDFDAITNYELLCKVVEYLNETVANVDLLNEKIEEFQNYFDNLDVQEEINNKLDEMAESGELENIISEYIELMTIYSYNTVSEMKQATNLVNGSFTKTSGFYSLNDGGGSYYKVRTVTNDDVVDEITIIALNDNTLVAELLILPEMSVRQFGAKGDNTTDDTNSIQTAINNCNNILIDNGTYLINVDEKINVKSNQKIEMINSTLKAIPTTGGNSWQNATAIINIDNIDNFSFYGNNSVLIGERSNHENTADQYGFGFEVNNSSSNIVIKDVIIKDFTGDGIILWNGVNKNIIIDNVVSDNNHRQGLSIVGCDNVLVSNSKFINTNGTNPEAGIDIEPDSGNYCNDIKIINCLIDNNDGDGIHVTNYVGTQASPQVDYINNLIIDKCIITNNGNQAGLNMIQVGIASHGNYKLINNIVENNVRGIRVASNYVSISGNIVRNNSNDGIYFNTSSYNVIDNNIIDNNLRYGIGIEDNSNYNKFTNNEISLNNYDGLSMYGNTNTTVNYNTISNNKIYKNSQNTSGSSNNIIIQHRCNYNTISNNDFTCDTSTTHYDISTHNQGTNNLISNNICKTGISLNGTNYTLMNVVNNVLDKGNLFI